MANQNLICKIEIVDSFNTKIFIFILKMFILTIINFLLQKDCTFNLLLH